MEILQSLTRPCEPSGVIELSANESAWMALAAFITNLTLKQMLCLLKFEASTYFGSIYNGRKIARGGDLIYEGQKLIFFFK